MDQYSAWQSMSGQGSQMSDPAYSDMMKRINKKQLESIASEQAGIDDLQSNINAQQASGVAFDLSPLAALSDSLTGSRLSQGYQKPESFKEKQKRIGELKNQLQKSRSSLSDNELDLLKMQLAQRSGMSAANQMRQGQLDQQQREDLIKSKQAQQVEKLAELDKAQQDYENLFKENGFEMFGDKKAALEHAYSNYKFKLKEAENLGAITAADSKLMDEAMPQVTGFGGALNYLGGLRAKGVQSGIDQSKARLKGQKDRNISTLELAFPSKGSQDLIKNYKKQFITPADQEAIDWANGPGKGTDDAKKILSRLGL